MSSITDMLWLIPLLPFLGALINALIGQKSLKEPGAGILAVLAALASFVVSVLAVMSLAEMPAETRGEGVVNNVYPWITMGRFQIDLSLTLDALSSVMILIVTGVGTLIHIYAMGYMHGDPRYSRFFTYLNLFLGSMLILVLGSNFILLYVGWELVGVCSYLLIGFWFDRPTAAAAGKKAFLVNRVGDFGFALGIMLIFFMLADPRSGISGPIHLTFNEVAAAVTGGAIPVPVAMGICLLLFWGATGKSAQLPLYVWLPDAMEGPTPVSALIHAATMVTAGVYMVARNHVLFSAGNPVIPIAGMEVPIVALIGALTAIFAASIALVQYDIKKVLAYSTVSQLGYMFVAVGVGAYAAGIFHLMTHAFFKACLFLGAGSVMHGLHDEVDMRRMGGLKRYMPATRWTFLISTIAIAGIPPLAGFFSKDLILEKAFEYHGGGKILWTMGIITALMTSFYMFRLYFRIFEGQPQRPYEEAHHPGHAHEADHSPSSHHGGLPHESPANMTGVLWILAILAIFGGFIGLPEALGMTNVLNGWLAPVFAHGGEAGHEAAHHNASLAITLSVISIVVAAAGWLLARTLYGKPSDPNYAKAQGLERNPVLQNKWYVDEAYQGLFVKPGTKLSFFSDAFDRYVVDGIVFFIAFMVTVFGEMMRFFQSGYIRWYAWGLLGGATILLGWMVLR
jgi:NADH-quinone oxidoreductase subunit L